MQSEQETFDREGWEEDAFFRARIVVQGMCMEHQPEIILILHLQTLRP